MDEPVAEPVDEELEHLERALAGRSRPVPPPQLRTLALAAVRRERTRERRLKLAAALALVGFVLSLRAPVSGEGDMLPLHSGEPENVRRELRALASLGFCRTDADPVALALRASAIPRLAQPIGSGLNQQAKLEGR